MMEFLMADVPLPIPFEAYTGNDSYVFVAYAHKDAFRVFSEIKNLHNSGLRIWFDGGIDPGVEWSDDIAKALLNSSMFVVFVTPNAVDSKNVKNEINFALNNNKKFLAIYLEETQLPLGLELRMGDIQAVLKWRMSESNYLKKLISAFSNELFTADRIPVIDMALVSAGEFFMGSPDLEKGRYSDEKVKKVVISKQFYIGKNLISQDEWGCLMSKNRSEFEDPKFPILNVSWDECQEFIEKLNSKTNGGYRLPTEAEWEYACRGGSQSVYSFGDTFNPSFANCKESNLNRPTPVGSYAPNTLGIYDMHGNVWEWCNDWLGNISSKESYTDPTGPNQGELRVMRGGAFNISSRFARSAFRNLHRTPAFGLHYTGFRVVKDVELKL